MLNRTDFNTIWSSFFDGLPVKVAGNYVGEYPFTGNIIDMRLSYGNIIKALVDVNPTSHEKVAGRGEILVVIGTVDGESDVTEYEVGVR
jgi:hypothetical protein